MFDDFDPRDCDDFSRDLEVRWIELERGLASGRPEDDPRDREQDTRERDRDTRDRHADPRDVFVHGLELPRGPERELLLDGDDRYELNGEDSRTLATTGAFRVISERDLFDARDRTSDARDDGLRELRDQGLIRTVSLDGRERAVTLTERGRHLLDEHRREREDSRGQAFYAGIDRPRELRHDAALYRAYLREEQRLRQQGADIRRVVLEQELKREYQCFLQERNRDRPDSDGRPDRDAREIEDWAREHDLPYFDDSVHFPDFRIEYEVNGLERHEDVEVLTAHYRGAHAASRARAAFTCYGRSSRSGGHPFDPDVAGRFV
jgi:DNA-binding PadR family transcriptional regulator